MAADFHDQRAEAAAAGRGSVAHLWGRTLVDVARRVPVEHLEVLRRDAGYALRLLRRRPAFAATVVLTLAIGIGLNTAVFSVVSGVLWRALPLPDGDRVVRLAAVESTAPSEFLMPAGLDMRSVSSYPDAKYWLPGRSNTVGPMSSRRNRGATAIGRLAPGVSRLQAQVEFDAISRALADAYPEDAGWSVKVGSPLESVVTAVSTRVWLLAAAAFCVLLIAAANVTNWPTGQFRHSSPWRRTQCPGSTRLQWMAGFSPSH
jgi:hypothetical protein